ncbi:MAG: fumarylacetoacetate hydrolase family protein [Planctomycetota bacterium]|nr:MAG: fumarylacetoacetate hydrolase family protein [Planctomycetota bacterium]
MKVIRFEDEKGRIRLGEAIDDEKARLIEGDLMGSFNVTDTTVGIGGLLAPLDPVNIIAIGLNYRRHAEESGLAIPDEPLIFSKLTSSVTGPRDPIILPTDAPDEVDYEGELAVVIGKTARKVTEAEALDYVHGYTCANDVSARDCQIRRDKQWTRAKSFDTFCPLGPCLVIDPEMDPNILPIRSRLNGRLMQDSNTADMIFSVPKLISYLSHQFTLLPGTVIVTGTPEGVGCARKPPVFLRAGDTITVEIDGIGELINPVKQDGQ